MSVPDRSKLNRFCLNCRNTAKEGGQWGVWRGGGGRTFVKI